MVTQMESPLSREKVERVVHEFYASARRDSQLGPIFDRAIPPEAWPSHLSQMVEFWSTVLLDTRSYRGNVASIHEHLADLTPELFETWLSVFGKTVYTLCEERQADEMMGVALRVARGLKIRLFGK